MASQLKRIVKTIAPQKLIDFRRQLIAEKRSRQQAAERQQARQQLDSQLCTSQAGQDLWVYGNVFDEKRDGFFLEVGAHDGVYLSNTYLLEKRYGWSGILVEANPASFAQLESNRTANCVNACVSSHEEVVEFSNNSVFGGIVAADCDNRDTTEAESVVKMQTVPLESVLDKANAPAEIDYFSIDIEGAEDRVLLEFPFERYKFTSLTIERPSPELREVFEKHGYLLVAEIPGLDCFYIHESHRKSYYKNTLAFHRKKFSIERFS